MWSHSCDICGHPIKSGEENEKWHVLLVVDMHEFEKSSRDHQKLNEFMRNFSQLQMQNYNSYKPEQLEICEKCSEIIRMIIKLKKEGVKQALQAILNSWESGHI